MKSRPIDSADSRREQRLLEHALVRAWIEDADDVFSLLEAQRHRHPFCGHFLELHQALLSQRLQPWQLERVWKAFRDLVDPDFRLLAWTVMIPAAVQLNRLDLAREGSRLAEADLALTSHPLLSQLVKVTQAKILGHVEDEDGLMSLFRQMPSRCRPDRVRETRIWFNRVLFDIGRLEGHPWIRPLQSVSRGTDKLNAGLARGLLWAHDSLSGTCLLPDPKIPAEAIAPLEAILLFASGWRAFISRQPLMNLRMSLRPESRARYHRVQLWLDAMRAIEERKLGKARTSIHVFQDSATHDLLDMHYQLRIRFTLASGRPLAPALLRWLNQRHRFRRPLDAWVLCRHHRLKGNTAEAAKWFRLALTHAKRWHLEHRWEREWALCHEIPAADLARWMLSANPQEMCDGSERLPSRAKADRQQRLATFLAERHRAHRNEITEHLGCSLATATTDLHDLIAQGRIAKRTPAPSRQTHYFEWVG